MTPDEINILESLKYYEQQLEKENQCCERCMHRTSDSVCQNPNSYSYNCQVFDTDNCELFQD